MLARVSGVLLNSTGGSSDFVATQHPQCEALYEEVPGVFASGSEALAVVGGEFGGFVGEALAAELLLEAAAAGEAGGERQVLMFDFRFQM